MLQIGSGIQQRRDFLTAQHGWQGAPHFRLGDFLNEPTLFECARVEELQLRGSLLECRPGELPLLEQGELILSDLLYTQLVRRLVKVAGKISNSVCVNADRMVGVIPQPQILNHSLA